MSDEEIERLKRERDIYYRIVLDLSRDPLNAKYELAVQALAEAAKPSHA